MISRMIAILLLVTAAWSVQAKEAEYIGGSLEMHNRVLGVASELRCLVCQGETLAESNSDFARDMRKQILEMMQNGKSDREVIDFLVARYGDTIRYRPPFKSTTVLLWFGPGLLLVVGIGVLYINLLRRRKQIKDVPLSAEDHRRAAELLRQEESGEGKA